MTQKVLNLYKMPLPKKENITQSYSYRLQQQVCTQKQTTTKQYNITTATGKANKLLGIIH